MMIFIVVMVIILPCIFYNPSGVISLGNNAVNVVEASFRSMVDDIYRVLS